MQHIDFARKKSSSRGKISAGRSYTRGAGKKKPTGKPTGSSDIKTAKNCKKGTACGRSCINSNKKCSDLTRSNTANAIAQYLKRGTTTSGKKIDDDERKALLDLQSDIKKKAQPEKPPDDDIYLDDSGKGGNTDDDIYLDDLKQDLSEDAAEKRRQFFDDFDKMRKAIEEGDRDPGKINELLDKVQDSGKKDGEISKAKKALEDASADPEKSEFERILDRLMDAQKKLDDSLNKAKKHLDDAKKEDDLTSKMQQLDDLFHKDTGMRDRDKLEELYKDDRSKDQKFSDWLDQRYPDRIKWREQEIRDARKQFDRLMDAPDGKPGKVSEARRNLGEFRDRLEAKEAQRNERGAVNRAFNRDQADGIVATRGKLSEQRRRTVGRATRGELDRLLGDDKATREAVDRASRGNPTPEDQARIRTRKSEIKAEIKQMERAEAQDTEEYRQAQEQLNLLERVLPTQKRKREG
jgi:hypothetical protein